MTVCHVSIVESLADSWLRFLTVVRGWKPEDDMRRATMMLTSSIRATASIELEIGAELAEMSCRARSLRQKHVKADLVALLTSSKHKRLRLQQTVRKRLALEQHLETLHSTLLNQQVMNSVKQTSEVLKSVGLEQEVSRIEEVNMNLQDSLLDVSAIQDHLATNGPHVHRTTLRTCDRLQCESTNAKQHASRGGRCEHHPSCAAAHRPRCARGRSCAATILGNCRARQVHRTAHHVIVTKDTNQKKKRNRLSCTLETQCRQ